MDLLRHVIHRLKLVQRLRQQMAVADAAGAQRQREQGGRGSAGQGWARLGRAGVLVEGGRHVSPTPPLHPQPADKFGGCMHARLLPTAF